jgi:DUF1009 family protein
VSEAGGRSVGLIAGNGRFPILFARAARKSGVRVIALAHHGETDPALADEVDELIWVYLGQFGRIADLLLERGVHEAAMVGGIGKLKAFRNARPDLRSLMLVARQRTLNDDALLRAIAGFFEEQGIRIVPSTVFLQEIVASVGPISGRKPTAQEERDVALGHEIAEAIGRADVGQTVVVKDGSVIAVEAAEGTDACIRRAGELAGEGFVVVKRCKPGQDQRFDLPAIGPGTIRTIAQAGGKVLAVEAGRTIVLDAAELVRLADEAGIAVIAR